MTSNLSLSEVGKYQSRQRRAHELSNLAVVESDDGDIPGDQKCQLLKI